jgi:hypothetical protein
VPTRAEEKGQEIRLRTLRDLDAAAIRLKDVVKVVIDPFCVDRQVRATIFGQNSPDELEKAVAIIEALTRPPEDKYYEYLLGNYSTIRRFLPYYNFSSDQFTGFHGIVIPGTLHDSPYVLDGLLEHETSLVPKELMTDTAGRDSKDVIRGQEHTERRRLLQIRSANLKRASIHLSEAACADSRIEVWSCSFHLEICRGRSERAIWYGIRVVAQFLRNAAAGSLGDRHSWVRGRAALPLAPDRDEPV